MEVLHCYDIQMTLFARTGARVSGVRIKRDPAKLLGSAGGSVQLRCSAALIWPAGQRRNNECPSGIWSANLQIGDLPCDVANL